MTVTFLNLWTVFVCILIGLFVTSGVSCCPWRCTPSACSPAVVCCCLQLLFVVVCLLVCLFSESCLCSRFPLVCGKQTARIHDSGWAAGCVTSRLFFCPLNLNLHHYSFFFLSFPLSSSPTYLPFSPCFICPFCVVLDQSSKISINPNTPGIGLNVFLPTCEWGTQCSGRESQKKSTHSFSTIQWWHNMFSVESYCWVVGPVGRRPHVGSRVSQGHPLGRRSTSVTLNTLSFNCGMIRYRLKSIW